MSVYGSMGRTISSHVMQSQFAHCGTKPVLGKSYVWSINHN